MQWNDEPLVNSRWRLRTSRKLAKSNNSTLAVCSCCTSQLLRLDIWSVVIAHLEKLTGTKCTPRDCLRRAIVGQRWWQRKTLIETRQCVLLLRLLLLLRLRTSRRGFTEGGGTGGRSGRVRRADGKSKRNSSVARRPATWWQKIESRTRRGHLWWRNGRDPSSELVWKMSDGLSRERGKQAVEAGERICAVGVTVRVITTGGQIVRAATNGQLITILWP